MKKILRTLATVLVMIEDIILIPISIVIVAIGLLVCILKNADFRTFATEYRWMLEGWYFKIIGEGKDGLRSIFYN
nr:MAG TPA: Cytochrome oxidase maturation protein cbb3-type [Caudoviricetes sp.]